MNDENMNKISSYLMQSSRISLLLGGLYGIISIACFISAYYESGIAGLSSVIIGMMFCLQSIIFMTLSAIIIPATLRVTCAGKPKAKSDTCRS